MAMKVATPANTSLEVSRTLQMADTVPPVVTSLQSLSGLTQVVPGQVVIVQAQASDNVAVRSIEFRTSGALDMLPQPIAIQPPVPLATAQFPLTVPAVAPDGSSIVVTAQARDVANVSTEVSLTLLVLRTANAAPVWRAGRCCFSTPSSGKNWIHTSAQLY